MYVLLLSRVEVSYTALHIIMYKNIFRNILCFLLHFLIEKQINFIFLNIHQ